MPDLLKRVEKDVIAKKPTIVVIQIGCNDARRIPKDSLRGSLEELIDRLQREKIQVIQCTLTSVGERHDGTNKDEPTTRSNLDCQKAYASASAAKPFRLFPTEQPKADAKDRHADRPEFEFE